MLRFFSALIILVLLAFGGVYFIFHSHFFQVAAIEVSGSDRADEIKGTLADVLAKGSKIRSWLGSDSLIFWSPKAIKEAPAALPWLSELNMERNWEDKKIIIKVKEREPFLLWCLSGQQTDLILNEASSSAATIPKDLKTASSTDTIAAAPSTRVNCYWIDEQGIVFAPAPEAEGFIIPKVFEKGGRQQLQFGQPFYDNPQLVENALKIIREVKNSSLAVFRFSTKDANLQELTAETSGFNLYFSLRFLPDDLERILANLANRLDLKKLEYIDFRVENRIYYK